MQEYINDDDFDGLKEYVNAFGRSDIEHILMEMNDESESDEFDDIDVQECIRSICMRMRTWRCLIPAGSRC